ncbi:MAG: D-alanyl-D-alanine carboxypeptidase [Acidobacteria bacterium]|nr:MAG: D-alanyl-D-alanine carboxypeptidase [Acidobacteriota bacterium]
MITGIRLFRTLYVSFSIALAVALTASISLAQTQRRGTLKHPVIDSRMTEKEAFDGLDPKCPEEIRKRQRLVTVKHYSMDGQIHQGQLVVDEELVSDVKKVFALALKEHFPIYSVIPISDKRFRKDNRWDDELSMEANNTSAFNYREITGGGRISNHAYGRAVDINTFLNPYIKGETVLPHGAHYDPKVEGTFTADNPIVREFLRLGWSWGGNWTSPIDYQHFEKPLKK